jgi:hypothetical protein
MTQSSVVVIGIAAFKAKSAGFWVCERHEIHTIGKVRGLHLIAAYSNLDQGAVNVRQLCDASVMAFDAFKVRSLMMVRL